VSITISDWHGPVIDVADQRWTVFFGSAEWSELLQWVAHQLGFPRWQNALGVYRVEYDVIDCPMIRVSRFVKDETGAMVLDPNGWREALRITTEHRVISPPPAWWKP
jgi:hypothetical protein